MASEGAELGECIRRADEYRRNSLSKGHYLDYLNTFDDHEIFNVFLKIYPQIEDDAEYWRCLNLAYTIKPIYLSDRKTWWLSLFKADRARRDAFMEQDEGDKAAFERLPGELTIYRGYQRGKHRSGISWTLSKTVALWFANRWPGEGQPMVVRGIGDKADVLGYTNGRQEEEIIIDPANVRGFRAQAVGETLPW